ncbi:MAG: hypothetical protein ABEL04_04090 [Salinibacter sp.]|uniref:hypothetical protein n=1 Tax=Salinibacter sp. TaxID=2065818 RepID=UPI0035D43F1F
MQRLRSISAWLLLVVFAAGGIGGPFLHQVHHASERAAPTDRSDHSVDVHTTEGTVWTDEAPDLSTLDCDLCARRLSVVTPAPAPFMAPQQGSTTEVEHRSHVASATVFNDWFVRGPPSLLEARPAAA